MFRKILSNLPKQHDFVRTQFPYKTPIQLSLLESSNGVITLSEKYHNGDYAYVFKYNANGNPHGFQECYYPDGTLESYETWMDGSLHGNYKKYNPDGSIREHGCYVSGIKTVVYER